MNRSYGRSNAVSSNGRQIRVMVVDDHAVIRQGLRMLLESRVAFRMTINRPEGVSPCTGHKSPR